MNKVWSIVRHEVSTTIKRRGYQFMTFGIPLLAAVIVLALIAFQSDDESDTPENPLADLPEQPIGYVDHSGLFQDPKDLSSVLRPYTDVTAAEDALKKDEISSLYIIAPDYLQTGDVTRKSKQIGLSDSQDTELFRAFLIMKLLQDENPQLLLRLYQPARVIEHQLDATGTELSQMDEEERYGSNFILVYGFAMILLFSTFIPSGYLLRSVVQEKENRTIEIVLSSLRPAQLLTGKVLGQGAVGLVQVLVWLSSGWALFNLAEGQLPALSGIDLSPNKILILLLYFLGGFTLTACLQAGVGAISTSMKEGPQYASFFTLPMVIPLWLLSIFIETPNSTVAVVLSLFPITAPLSMVQRIAITVVPWWQLALSLTLLAGCIALTLWLAAKIFRVQTLLSGTLPRPAELLGLIRQA